MFMHSSRKSEKLWVWMQHLCKIGIVHAPTVLIMYFINTKMGGTQEA